MLCTIKFHIIWLTLFRNKDLLPPAFPEITTIVAQELVTIRTYYQVVLWGVSANVGF